MLPWANTLKIKKDMRETGAPLNRLLVGVLNEDPTVLLTGASWYMVASIWGIPPQNERYTHPSNSLNKIIFMGNLSILKVQKLYTTGHTSFESH
jgi:hypothetical protein